MANKQTYSKPVTTWKPDSEGSTSKLLSSSGREITHLKLIASGASAHVELYNASSIAGASTTDLVWELDASTTVNDDDDFANPLYFSKGIVAKLTQGTQTNPILCLAYIPDQP